MVAYLSKLINRNACKFLEFIKKFIEYLNKINKTWNILDPQASPDNISDQIDYSVSHHQKYSLA